MPCTVVQCGELEWDPIKVRHLGECFSAFSVLTSVLLQDIQSLTFMQKTADQTMGLCQCLMSSPGQDIHTDIHSLYLEFSFKESILHIIYKLNKKSNKGPLLPPKVIIYNLITKGKNSTGPIYPCKCHSPVHSCRGCRYIQESLNPVVKAAQGL